MNSFIWKIVQELLHKLCGLEKQNRALAKSAFNLAIKGLIPNFRGPGVHQPASGASYPSTLARFCLSPEILAPLPLIRFPG